MGCENVSLIELAHDHLGMRGIESSVTKGTSCKDGNKSEVVFQIVKYKLDPVHFKSFSCNVT
jgi:hypothetical protein